MENLESTPLFFEPRTVTKIASRYRKLSNNSGEWGRQIQDALYNEHPQLNSRQVQIHWESKDDSTGNAVGRITIDGRISIPIFVENFKLAPLDTFVDKNVRPHRINPRRLKEALFNADLFDGIATPHDERGLMPDIPLARTFATLPWEEGRRIYANDSLLDRVLETAIEADLVKFSKTLEEDPQLAVNFHAYGHRDKIAKILNTRAAPVEKLAQDLANKLPVSVTQFRYLQDGTLTMKVASDSAYAPQECVLADGRFKDILANLGVEDTGMALRKAASPSGFVVTSRRNNAEPVFQSTLRSADVIQKFGHYVVKDGLGGEHRGWVFPKVYSLDKEAMPMSLFLGEDIFVLQSKVAGVANPTPPENLPTGVPRVGDTGSFVFQGDGNSIALEPMTIRAIEKVGEEIVFTTDTLHGRPARFHLSKMARDLVRLPKEKGEAYLLPTSAHFAKLNGLVAKEVLVGDSQLLTKMASEDVLGPNTIRVAAAVDGRFFLFQGKLADRLGAGTEQYPDEALFKLASLGLSAESAEAVLKKALHDGPQMVGGLKSPMFAADVLGQEKRASHMQLLATLPHMKQDTVKIAADIKDPAVLDRVLALNFLNPQNIGVLVDHMDDLESTGTRLSEMLIASRVGAKEDLDESSIIQARQAIDDVLDGLSNLRSRLGPQTSTEETGGSVD